MKRFLPFLILLLAPALTLRAAETGVSLRQDAHGVSVTVNGQPFASYVIDQTNKPYLWPVIGPTGKAMTRAFPMEQLDSESKAQRDHPHHRGILFGHESSGTTWSLPEKWDSITGDEKVTGGGDTWHERRTFEEYMENPKNALRGKQRMPMLGRIQHKEFTELKAEGDHAVIAEVCEYLDPAGKRFLTEHRRITFRASGETRSIDFDQDFIATDGPASFGDRKDAGLSIRVPASMAVDSKQGGHIVTSEGATDADAWGKAAKWCDYSGPVEGESLGIALLSHPSTYRFPTRWHVRAYGLFSANPFAVHDFDKAQPDSPTELKAGERLALRHRFVFHRGDAQAAKIEAAWTAYAAETIPPLAAAKTAAEPGPAPTQANVPYGTHERQVLDFYQAKSDQPTPLLFFIHGGGWVTGDKKNPGGLKRLLDSGISVVSINYRYSWQAQIAGVKPPVKAPLEDAARALQFVRSKAKEWNIDKQRIAASGGSAGACSSIWLAMHADMADPKSSDPIARESTRLWTAAVDGAQTSLDPLQLKEWTPNSRYGGHAFGFMDPNDLKSRDTRFAEFLEHRAEVLPWIKEYSPIEHASADDPPLYLIYRSAPALSQEQKDPTHTANYGVKLQEKLKSLGVECELVYPGAPDVKHKTIDAYLIETLKK